MISTAIAFAFGGLAGLVINRAVNECNKETALSVLTLWLLFTLYMFNNK
jgi:hypothetical protein